MSASQIRQYLSILDAEDDHTFFLTALDGHRPLTEAHALTESALADRVKAVMVRVSEKIGAPSFEFLTQITDRASRLFQGNAAVSGALKTLLAAGRTAARNATVMLALVGMAGTLLALSNQPQAAEAAAGKIAQVSSGNVDQIIAALKASGIEVDTSASGLQGLPKNLATPLKKAAAALKAISDFEFKQGLPTSSTRSLMNSVRIEAGIEKAETSFVEDIVVKTADGTVTIAHIHTEVRDGQVVNDAASGVKFDLLKMLDGLDDSQEEAVGAYLRSVLVDGAHGSVDPQAVLQHRAGDIALLVAKAADRDGKLAKRVRIGPSGIQVA